MLKCTLNGKTIEVKEGTTIIEAFMQAGSEIAHYCWHPGLSVAGVCRLCMVKIEGNPKLQIACNTVVTDGMIVSNELDEVKDVVKWGLDFHLINHPLDCPICDQAGECGLQDQYMKFGKYDPEMAERKVKKRKVVDLGPTVVLDTERCILCARCTRFTEEVSKTNELGIFNRGDHSEVGTYADRPLDNNYSLNTVDICPVGALTSKDFRFKQRVWFLKEAPSICTGCSTGCNTKVYYNREGAWRMKPLYNPDVNGYWMCDVGREMYKNVNQAVTLTEGERENKRVYKKQVRLMTAVKKAGAVTEELSAVSLSKQVAAWLKAQPSESVALVVTGQHTNEELSAVISYFTQDLNSKNVFYWAYEPEKFNDFDGILYRGDHNPNTKGLRKILDGQGLSRTVDELGPLVNSGQIKTVFVLGPENLPVYPDLEAKLSSFKSAEKVIWLSACTHTAFEKFSGNIWLLPLKTFAEKSGTYTNFKDMEQHIRPVSVFVEEALSANEVVTVFRSGEVDTEAPVDQRIPRVQNEFLYIRGEL